MNSYSDVFSSEKEFADFIMKLPDWQRQSLRQFIQIMIADRTRKKKLAPKILEQLQNASHADQMRIAESAIAAAMQAG